VLLSNVAATSVHFFHVLSVLVTVKSHGIKFPSELGITPSVGPYLDPLEGNELYGTKCPPWLEFSYLGNRTGKNADVL